MRKSLLYILVAVNIIVCISVGSQAEVRQNLNTIYQVGILAFKNKDYKKANDLLEESIRLGLKQPKLSNAYKIIERIEFIKDFKSIKGWKATTIHNSPTNYIGEYIIPADESLEEGTLDIESDSGQIIGYRIQRVKPMGGTYKSRIRIYSINNKGVAKYEAENKIYDRWGKEIQNSAESGNIVFIGNSIKYKKQIFQKK